MDKLKPCPFCGSKNVKIYSWSDGGVCVKCLDCYCQTQSRSDSCISDAKRESAVEHCIQDWNKRTNYYTPEEVRIAMTLAGQGSKKFAWGETIRFSPTEVEKILAAPTEE